MIDIRKRLYFLSAAALTALAHNLIHELIHYLMARLFGEPVLAFHFLTNGWGTSRVVYGTPAAARAGWEWLVIAWAPAVVTTLLGYLLYVNHRRWLTEQPLFNAVLWFGSVYFLLLDAFYFGVLSFFVPGSDPYATQVMNWPVWPVQLVALAVLVVNARLAWKLKQFANGHSERYLPTRA